MKYILMNLYFSRIFDSIKKVVFVKMQMKIHLMKNLKINMLIEMNVFTSHKFLLNYVFQSIIINNY